jgi:hypothetical protein
MYVVNKITPGNVYELTIEVTSSVLTSITAKSL